MIMQSRTGPLTFSLPHQFSSIKFWNHIYDLLKSMCTNLYACWVADRIKSQCEKFWLFSGRLQGYACVCVSLQRLVCSPLLASVNDLKETFAGLAAVGGDGSL